MSIHKNCKICRETDLALAFVVGLWLVGLAVGALSIWIFG